MKGEMIEDFDWNGNDYAYKKGQVVEVYESGDAVFNYATYKDGVLDWIPKSMVMVS